MSKHRNIKGAAFRKLDCRLKLFEGFVKHPFLQMCLPQPGMRNDKVWVHFQSFSALLNYLIVLARKVKKQRDICIVDQGEWIKFPSFLRLCESFLVASHCREIT